MTRDAGEAVSRSATTDVFAFLRRHFVLITVASAAVLRIYRDVIWPYHIGLDARVYIDASRVWLAGGDPWLRTYELGVPYGAPPTSLLATAPLTLLPTGLGGLVLVLISVALALAAIRSLGLPMWWILWTPLLDGVLVGSLDVATMALLILGRARLSGIAPFLKVYAVVPMIGERRWRALVVVVALLLATVPLVPWPMFLANFDLVRGYYDNGVVGTMMTVYPAPLVWVAMAAGLLTLGLRRAGWLAVPVLWPSTQAHYAAIALPVVATSSLLTIGFAWAWLIPLAAPASVGVYILRAWISRSSPDRRRSGRPSLAGLRSWLRPAP